MKIRAKIRTAVTGLALVVGMLVALPGPASAVLSSSDTYEASVISATNYQRAIRGRVKLSPQWCVDRYAESHARWMATNRTLKHQSLSRILSYCGLRSVGENIAVGYRTGTLAVAAWMASYYHRLNILKWGYRLIGVGAYQDTSGRWWVSQVFGTKL